ncbi:hypothetical protein [Enterobacter roggenkampii]|uniref:hypothetical protein n=1 Tax=Enterobacter roggenkampii TaxID=1812935 RepID=UPI001E42B0E2|nr:hypothetical protein [Enterobacter roggenkampii]MCE1350291.1 hypothetical protein [Enterobacter roggenkampii]MDV0393452.1 hypothetical protein [Enterobacter roggenkampii]
MSKLELLKKLASLATECHTLACELDLGDERTEMFEMYNVLRNLGRKEYASQISKATNPLLLAVDDNDDDWDEDDE